MLARLDIASPSAEVRRLQERRYQREKSLTMPGDERAAGLLPCGCTGKPVVAGEDTPEGAHMQFVACCRSCGQSSGYYDTAEFASAAWNRAMSGPTGWRDIASAPRDGTRVMLWFPVANGGRGMSIFGHWHLDKYSAKPRPYWWNDQDRIYGMIWMRANLPTAWQPLPLPPTNGDTNEG